MSWQGISELVGSTVPSAASTCICVLMAHAELAEIGSHSKRKRQMSFFIG